MNKRITFEFKDPQHFLPDTPGPKFALFEIFQGDHRLVEYGFTEWDGTIFGLPDLPAAGCTVSLLAWAELPDPEQKEAKILTVN
jgi:hypothetical protein